MRTSFITIFGLFAGSMAVPALRRQAGICASGIATPQCCDVDVLGVADLDCETPPSVPTDIPDFVNICAAVGKIDMCCDIPILGQALLCQSP